MITFIITGKKTHSLLIIWSLTFVISQYEEAYTPIKKLKSKFR